MIKKVQEMKELYIQFTEEEMIKLNIERGQKFSMEILDDKTIVLKPFVKIDIDLSAFAKEDLVYLINESVEKDISINDVIVDCLKKSLNIVDNI
jgi:hypothetical protein